MVIQKKLNLPRLKRRRLILKESVILFPKGFVTFVQISSFFFKQELEKGERTKKKITFLRKFVNERLLIG